MQPMKLNGVLIDDTFAEAFGMRAAAIVITADSLRWARQAAVTMTGYATSVIGCGCEAAIDRELRPIRRPTGGPAFACSSSRCRRPSCRTSFATASDNAS